MARIGNRELVGVATPARETVTDIAGTRRGLLEANRVSQLLRFREMFIVDGAGTWGCDIHDGQNPFDDAHADWPSRPTPTPPASCRPAHHAWDDVGKRENSPSSIPYGVTSQMRPQVHNRPPKNRCFVAQGTVSTIADLPWGHNEAAGGVDQSIELWAV